MENKTKIPTPQFLFNIVSEVLANAFMARKINVNTRKETSVIVMENVSQIPRRPTDVL